MRVWIIASLCLQEASINRSLDDCWTNCTEMLGLCGKEMTELEFQEVEKYRYHFWKMGVIGRGGVSAEVISSDYQIQDKEPKRKMLREQQTRHKRLCILCWRQPWLFCQRISLSEIIHLERINQQMFSKENAEWSRNIYRQNLRRMLKQFIHKHKHTTNWALMQFSFVKLSFALKTFSNA